MSADPSTHAAQQPSWLLLHLAASASPAGGVAQSGGVEAAWQHGGVTDFADYVDQSVWQAGYGALPFVGAAAREPEGLPALDAACDAFLTNHVANRASRAQGRALYGTAA